MDFSRSKVKTNGFTHVQNRNECKDNRIRLVSKDGIRYLKVKQTKPNRKSGELNREALEEIKVKALNTPQKTPKCPAKSILDTAAGKAEAQKRIERMKRLGSGTNNQDIEKEKSEKHKKILEIAKIQRLNQEEDVKELNRRINEAQCFYIRDLQVEENRKLKEQRINEELMLNEMMKRESDRQEQIELQMEEEKARLKPIQAAKLIEQIKERENMRILANESKISENKKLCEEQRSQNEARIMEMVRQKQKQVEDRRKWHKENEKIRMAREAQREFEKMEDAKVQQEAQQMEQRAAELEAKSKAKQAAKERELAILRSQQEKANNDAADRDALLARRAQERNERAWRKKELEDAKQRAQMVKQLQADRLAQLEESKRQRAAEQLQDRAEFEKIMRLQKNKDMQEIERLNKEQLSRSNHRDTLLKQIDDKQSQLIDEHRGKIKMGEKEHVERQKLKQEIDALKLEKIKTLEDLNVSKNYISSLKRAVLK